MTQERGKTEARGKTGERGKAKAAWMRGRDGPRGLQENYQVTKTVVQSGRGK